MLENSSVLPPSADRNWSNPLHWAVPRGLGPLGVSPVTGRKGEFQVHWKYQKRPKNVWKFQIFWDFWRNGKIKFSNFGNATMWLSLNFQASEISNFPGLSKVLNFIFLGFLDNRKSNFFQYGNATMWLSLNSQNL